MGATSVSRVHRRWSFVVIIILLVSLVSVAFVYNPSVYGVEHQQVMLDRAAESEYDFEVGENDFRISDMGPDGTGGNIGNLSSIAYNSTNHEYFVVWSGLDSFEYAYEIYGQRIDAATGEEIGENDFPISQMRLFGEQSDAATYPNVVYNSHANEYLVVWVAGFIIYSSDLDFPNDLGIYGQRIDAATGEKIGEDSFRIDQEPPPSVKDNYDPENLALTYNSTHNEYLLVWTGNPTEWTVHDLFAQRLNTTGFPIDEIPVVIEEDVSRRDRTGPDVTYNDASDEYLLVWSNEEFIPSQSTSESEIFGQRLDGATGAEVGVSSFRISDMGPDGDGFYDAYNPTVAYNSDLNEYLVTWSGNEISSGRFQGEFEIYGQRLGSSGQEIGINDFRISDIGPEGDSRYRADNPTIVFNNQDNEYLVAWEGDDTDVYETFQIYGQRLGSSGQEIGINDFRISDIGPEGEYDDDYFYGVFDNNAVAYNSHNNEYLVTWDGVDSSPNGNEIFGQRLAFRDDIMPTPTIPPACDPARDVWGKIRGLGWVEIGNRSQTCTYPVGGAIYIIPSGDINDPDIDSQEWYDDTTAEVAPGERITVRVDIPACAVVQQDAFWGEPLKSLDGQRYGERLLAATRYRTGGMCEPTPTSELPSTTPEPTTTPVETATPMVPTATSPAASPTATLAVPTSTSVAPTPTATTMPEVVSPIRSSRIFIPLLER
ncbi:MAG: hypothetical protein AAGF95_11205 [Chloroflexota bacterium]